MDSDVRVDREQVLAFRWRAHQLRPGAGIGLQVADTVLLDFGVQDTGPRGARWALANRGLETYDDADVLLAWTVRVSPHLYRREDLAELLVATAPLNEADAGKRIHDAARPLRRAGIPVLDALAVIAEQQREIVTAPMDKGTLSTALTPRLDPPYLRRCEPCQATHAWESPFRIAALQGGLEDFEPGDVAPGAAPDPALPAAPVRPLPEPRRLPASTSSATTCASSALHDLRTRRPSSTRRSRRSPRTGPRTLCGWR